MTNEWVLVSPHRTQRPWQGAVETLSTVARPAYDPTCYLCPGNWRAGEVRNPQYQSTFIFENDFAALKKDVAGGEHWTCKVKVSSWPKANRASAE